MVHAYINLLTSDFRNLGFLNAQHADQNDGRDVEDEKTRHQKTENGVRQRLSDLWFLVL